MPAGYRFVGAGDRRAPAPPRLQSLSGGPASPPTSAITAESSVTPWVTGARAAVIERGGIYWADLGAPAGCRPARRRAIIVISADTYNRSRLATVVAAVLTAHTGLATMPGNVLLPAEVTGLPKDSVANITALITLNKTDLGHRAGRAPLALQQKVDRGLLLVLDL